MPSNPVTRRMIVGSARSPHPLALSACQLDPFNKESGHAAPRAPAPIPAAARAPIADMSNVLGVDRRRTRERKEPAGAPAAHLPQFKSVCYRQFLMMLGPSRSVACTADHSGHHDDVSSIASGKSAMNMSRSRSKSAIRCKSPAKDPIGIISAIATILDMARDHREHFGPADGHGST